MPKQKDPFSFADEDGQNHRLTLKQRLFCEEYLKHRGNGAKAAKAAGYAVKRDNTLKSIASENLTKPDILAYIKFLLKEAGLSDAAVDQEMLWVIRQNANLHAKMRGIAEYNKIRGRYAPDKSTVEQKGDILVIEKGWRVEKGDRDRD